MNSKPIIGPSFHQRFWALTMLMLLFTMVASAQDTVHVKKGIVATFDTVSKKAEALFKVVPFPIFSYTSEAGLIVGLTKFNLFQVGRDHVSKLSRISGVATYSTRGRISIAVANDLIFDANRYMILSYISYRKTPEYFFGIGNNIDKNNKQQISVDRAKLFTAPMRRVAKDFYAGFALDISDYFNVEMDSSKMSTKESMTGVNGGWCVGSGFSLVYDNRDNRYNATRGNFVMADVLFYENWMGSKYKYTKIDIDTRKYFNPWFRHVIAVQATTTYENGDVPFFELAKMGGARKMRGYYEGAYRDKVLVDAQAEYRMPVWNIFGVAAWVGTGRVVDKYSNLQWQGFHLSYGAGLRVRVDSKNNTNLRFDYGFGQHGMQGFYIDFSEAF